MSSMSNMASPSIEASTASQCKDFDSDYLILEFAGGDKLYVPLERLDQVQRYSGADGHAPRLERLGGANWAKTTARVKKDIEEMAHELVDLYANRELVTRHAYGFDSTHVSRV